MRIAALEWLPVEMCLSAGIVPTGIADPGPYREWVGYGAERLAAATDLGTRQQPALESLARLKPDLIIGSVLRHRTLLSRLEAIAPTLLLADDRPGDQLAMVDAAWRDCSRALRLSPEPQAAAFDTRLAAAAARIGRRGLRGAPVVLAQPMPGTPRMRMFTQDAAAARALERVGLVPGLVEPDAPFGFVTVGPEGLARLSDNTRLLVLASEIPPELRHSAIWSVLPVARSGRVHAIGAVWAFGGYESLAELVDHAVAHMGTS